MTFKIHKKIARIYAEMRHLQKDQTPESQESYSQLERKVKSLEREYIRHNGFNYNPIFYEGRTR